MATRKPKRIRTKPKASSRDIINSHPLEDQIAARWKKYYRRLLNLREALLHSRHDLATDAVEDTPTFCSHMADAGTDTYDRDMALGLLSSEQDAVYQIDQALDRLRAGTFGKCELTGRPIEKERLEAIPWTRFSAEAERKLESEGALRRSALGPRDSVAKVELSSEEETEGE